MDPERSTKEQYRECMHNHAASLGSYATDGCGEFMADGGGMLCAACGCHRNFHRRYVAAAALPSPVTVEERGGEKKRTRTKFSAEQKERMQSFAEKIGWRVQKKSGGVAMAAGDEIAVFCREIGVSRQVFKVWMHNHKGAASGEAPPETEAAAPDEEEDEEQENESGKGNVSSLTQ